MFKFSSFAFLILIACSTINAKQPYPKLNSVIELSTLDSLEQKYLAQKDTIGLIYTYALYLDLKINSENERITKSLFFFIENEDALNDIRVQDKYEIRVLFLAYYYGANTNKLNEIITELEEIAVLAEKNKWTGLLLRSFLLKYYLIKGDNQVYEYPIEIKQFYKKNEALLGQPVYETMVITQLMAYYYLQQQQYDLSLIYFEKALDLSLILGKKHVHDEVYELFIAQVLRLKGEFNQAELIVHSVLKRLKGAPNISEMLLIKWAYEELAYINEGKQDFKTALNYWNQNFLELKEISKLENSLQIERGPALIEKLEIEFHKKKEAQVLQQQLFAQSKRSTLLINIIFYSIGTSIILILFFILYRFKRSQKKRNKENELRILTKQEEEREQISRELHDYVGNSLIAIKNAIPTNDPKIVGLINEVYATIRTTSRRLSSSHLEEVGLTAMVKDFIALIDKEHKFIQSYVGTAQPVDMVILKSIYRIIQELCGNALKHSHSETIHLSVFYQQYEILVNIEDNGIGFDSNQNQMGNGLRNIQYRVKALHGKIEIDAKPSKGTSIWIKIPI